jgi:two-component system, OmpR family, phosphate regulon sensor histidine kinase PhoR
MHKDSPNPPSENADTDRAYVPRILVVDDEQRIRLGCQVVLKKEGYYIALADDGKVGLEMIAAEHFDIVLLDLMMPSLSGFDVLAHIKEHHPDTVVIVITGYATLEHSIAAMKQGAFDFVPKPFTPDQLRAVVSKAIHYTRALTDIATEKSRMRGLINRLYDGVMATDIHKRVVLCNPAFRRLIGSQGLHSPGCDVGEIVGDTPLLRLIHRALNMDSSEFIELTEELTLGDMEAEDGKILAARCFPFRDRQGLNLGTITVLHDITARKRMDQHKSDFVSMVAHEIRSPMSSVLMQLNVLLDGLAGELNEKQRQVLDRATIRIRSLVDLSSELLDLTKIESGLIAQERVRLQVLDLIRGQIELHGATADAKQITLTAELPAELPPVIFHQQSLDEVISNLINNAIKYTPDGGRVTVSAGVEGDEICLRVRDTGFGIAPEDQPQVFRRFYRVKNAETRFITGTGLGLPIVQQILEAHQGRIELESTVGEGSTFTVYIPLQSS